MAGGFLRGVLWGGVVSLGVAGTASVLGDRMEDAPPMAAVPETAPVETEVVAVPEMQPAPALSSETVAPKTPTMEYDDAAKPVTAATETDRTNAPNPDKPDEEVRDAEVIADTDPAPVPEVGTGASGLDSPGALAQQGGVDVQTDAQVQPVRQSDALEQPSAEAPLTVATEPATPLPPKPAVTEVAVEPSQENKAAQPPEPNEIASATPEPSSEPAPEVQSSAAIPAEGTEAESEAAPEQVAALAPKIATNRLPTVQATPPAAETAEPEQVGKIVFDSELPPIRRFAVPFENSEAKPLMAIVLMDDGSGIASGTAGATALSSFPYPITFAVDSGLPDAAEKMQRYRADGFEVMAMVNLPEASSATDAEVSMGVALNAVPEAVAVLEGPVTGVQGNREMFDQVTSILADSGLGLVTRPKGLNTAQKLASRNGVPAATLFRDFDGEGQKPEVIRRFLDQAVFRAGRDGGVIMVGRLRPDTISALLLWGLQDRAGRVALAPVSAVLTAQQDQQ